MQYYDDYSDSFLNATYDEINVLGMYPNLPDVMQSQYMYSEMMPSTVMEDPYSYPQNFSEAFNLIQEAIAGEQEDELFYNYLINVAPSEEDKNMIASVRDDERKHNDMFRRIYYELTGQILPNLPNTSFEAPKSYCEGLQKALLGELRAIERYRRILFAMQDRRMINMLTEIITDEIKHSSKYNFLYSKNGCSPK